MPRLCLRIEEPPRRPFPVISRLDALSRISEAAQEITLSGNSRIVHEFPEENGV